MLSSKPKFRENRLSIITYWGTRISAYTFHISRTTWLKFGTEYFHLLSLSSYEFRENWCIQWHTLRMILHLHIFRETV